MRRREPRGRLSVGPQCPDGHGDVYAMDTGRYHCPHVAHLGRPHSHPEGPADATQRFFTDEEVYSHLKQKE